MTTTSGVLFIHSTPSALRPHIEWAVSASFGTPIRFLWTRQPAEPEAWRAEYTWHDEVGAAVRLVATLRRFERLRFEVTEEPTATTEGLRFSFTPQLGLFVASTNAAGDIVVPEERLRAALDRDLLGKTKLRDEVNALLGGPWDEELEEFRYAGEDTPVRWLRQVV